MNIKSILTKSTRLIIVFSFLLGCKGKPHKSFHAHLFKDFDVFSKTGIGEIDINQNGNFNFKNEPFFKLINRGHKLDSIVITNPYGKGSRPMRLRVVEGDSVTLYVTSYPYDGGTDERSYYKTYYAFSPKKAIRYTRWSRYGYGWLVIFINSNGSFGGGKIIEPRDTVNFEKRLLKRDSIKMMTMRLYHIEKYSNILNKEFTFIRWLHDDKFRTR